MASCSYCGSTILFGGKADGELRFCNQKCLEKGIVLRFAQRLPEQMIAESVAAVHRGSCPKCGGVGPVDVHVSHRVWSALFLTSWSSRPEVCCTKCGVKGKIGEVFFCGFLGWWGFPWGLIMTPVQIVRNVVGIFTPPDPAHPSAALQSVVRADIAARFIASQQQSGSQPPPVPGGAKN